MAKERLTGSEILIKSLLAEGVDTVFGYAESSSQPNTLNSEIGLRSDAAYGQGESTTIRCHLGISTYSPQYVTISVGSGADATITAYVGPESRYVDPDTGIEYEGTLFSFPIRGINKEFGITGAGNIKRINRLQSLNLTEARIEKATKILELDFSYSNRMSALKIGNNGYLRKLVCNNSYQLGTATESQTLDLSNCYNLKEVDISYTKFTGILFPVDTVLNSINLTGSTVKNISIDGAEFLNDIRITDCEFINRFELNRCNRIETIDVSGSTIQNFIVTNCEKVNNVNLSNCKSIAGFDVTNSYNIEELNLRGNTSPIMNDLKLYSMYSLKKLIVSESTTAHTIRLPKYLNEDEAFKAANGQSALPWNTLEYLDLSSSSIKKIQYGSADVAEEVADMSQLDQLTYLSFNSCTSLIEIRNLKYTGNLSYLFYACKNLQKISGMIANTTDNISYLFASCYLLANIDGLTLNFNGVTNANYACDRCHRFKTPMVKKVLNACGSTLESICGLCHMHSEDGIVGILGTELDTTREIPADMFIRNTKLKDCYHAFDITGYTSVSGDLLNPCASTVEKVQYMFSRMANLKSVGNNLLKNKPNLKDASYVFASDPELVNYIDQDPNIFVGSYSITTTAHMFSGCTKLICSDLGQMLYPLTKLQYTHYMFFNCPAIDCVIPDGLLSKNTELIKINGMFQKCSKLPTVPRSLFRETIGSTNNLTKLTSAVGVFGTCTSMEGIVDSTFFLGVPNLTNIGYNVVDNYPWSTTKYPTEGFFQGTKITGYHETFLNPLTKLQDTSGFFRNCTSLVNCHYYQGSEVYNRGNSISGKLFEKNPLLHHMAYTFAGCSALDGHIPPSLFDACRANLNNVDAIFYNCTGLTGLNLDATGDDKLQTGISSEWLKNCTNLSNAASFISGCTNYVGEVPEDLLEGCTKLTRTHAFFNNCKKLTGGVPLRLFDSCRDTLTDAAYMFQGCEALTDPLPVGEYYTEKGITEYRLVSSETEGALKVVENMIDPFTEVAYSTVVTISPNLATSIVPNGGYCVLPIEGNVVRVTQLGLLSECLNLTTIAGLFNGCKSITGGIPHDLLFTSSNAKKYTKLINIDSLFKNCEKINEGWIEEETKIKYICNPVLFEKCTALVNCNSVFNRMYAIPTDCQIHPNTFLHQTKVTSAYELFMGTKVTGAVPSTLFVNSLNTLTDARKMFALTNITSVGATFLNNGGANKKLAQIYGLFYNCSNIVGTSPEFWNGNKFTAIAGNQNGFWGALYNCTKLSNYAAAQGVSKDWTAQQQIYL